MVSFLESCSSFVLACFPFFSNFRIRRGIDIDAGCGQLTVKVAQDDVLGKGL